MIIHNFEQGTPEWYNIRKGKMTASNAQAIGNKWKGLITYVNALMAEYYSSADKEHYTNKDIERGNELEKIARDMYELETGDDVQQVGFCEFDEYSGCSPDWLIGSDWGMEIKCQSDPIHFALITHGVEWIDTKYLWQIQMCLYITGRKWRDFVSYNPNYKKSLIIHRIVVDEWMRENIVEWLDVWKLLIQSTKAVAKEQLSLS